MCDFFKIHGVKMRFSLGFASGFFYCCDYYHILKKYRYMIRIQIKHIHDFVHKYILFHLLSSLGARDIAMVVIERQLVPWFHTVRNKDGTFNPPEV